MQCCQLNLSQDVTFGDIADTNHLLLVSEQIHSVLQKSILIVGYRGVSGKLPSVKTSLNNLTRPQKCIFETLALIASAQQMASMKNLNIKNFDYVVCMYGTKFVCQLSEPYHLEVLNRCLEQKDVLRDKVETLEVGAGGSNLFKQTAAEEAESKFKYASGKRLKTKACDNIKNTVNVIPVTKMLATTKT